MRAKTFSFFSLSCWMFMALAEAEGQSEWERTVAEAKKEGQVTIYISGYDAVLPAFQKAYPDLKVVGVTGRGSQLVPRILTERRAGKYLADVYSAGSTGMYTLYQAKALDPLKPALILPEVADTSKWWRGIHRYLDPEGKYIFAYTGNVGGGGLHFNTNLVSPGAFINGLIIIRTSFQNPSRPPFSKGRSSPLWQRGVRGDFQDSRRFNVSSILRPFISPTGTFSTRSGKERSWLGI